MGLVIGDGWPVIGMGVDFNGRKAQSPGKARPSMEAFVTPSEPRVHTTPNRHARKRRKRRPVPPLPAGEGWGESCRGSDAWETSCGLTLTRTLSLSEWEPPAVRSWFSDWRARPSPRGPHRIEHFIISTPGRCRGGALRHQSTKTNSLLLIRTRHALGKPCFRA